jgi:hypothetical protein
MVLVMEWGWKRCLRKLRRARQRLPCCKKEEEPEETPSPTPSESNGRLPGLSALHAFQEMPTLSDLASTSPAQLQSALGKMESTMHSLIRELTSNIPPPRGRRQSQRVPVVERPLQSPAPNRGRRTLRKPSTSLMKPADETSKTSETSNKKD